MAILKLVKLKDYSKGVLCLLQHLNYVMRINGTKTELMYGYYVGTTNPHQEMLLCKQSHAVNLPVGAMNPLCGKSYIEVVISLLEAESCYIGQFCKCVADINMYFSNYNGAMYQVLSCIHIDTDNLHAHFVINNIEMITGKRLSFSRADLYSIKDDMSILLTKYNFSAISRYRSED